MRNLGLSMLVGVALLCGPGVWALESLAWSADGFGVAHPLTGGQVRNVADRALWTWGGADNAPQIKSSVPSVESPQPSLDPYMWWNTPREVRVLRLFADWDWGGYITSICVDTLTPGGDPANPSSWVQRYDSSAYGDLAAVLIHGVDLGQVYTTEGVRVRVTYGPRRTDDRRSLAEVEVFGDIGGTLESQKVLPNSWAASSNHPNAGVNGLAGTARWVSLTIADNTALGHDFFFVDRHFNIPTDLNLLSIAWRGTADSSVPRVVPEYWMVQYKTEDSAGWLDAGTFLAESNINGGTAQWYYNDLGDLTGVTDLRIVVPYDAFPTIYDETLDMDVPNPNYGLVIHMTETFNIHIPPIVPEPATMSLLVLGGLALLRRRGR